MAGNKKKKKKSVKQSQQLAAQPRDTQPGPSPGASNAPNGNSALWPASFASPRKTTIILLVLGAASLLLLGPALTNHLIWLKRLLGYLIGLPANELLTLDAISLDIYLVVVTLLWMIGGALIHPAVGLGVLIIIRPWLDGYTYPMDNMYFIWAILAITAWWNLRLLMLGGRYRGVLPILVLLGFLLSALATAPASYQLDNTYFRLVVWFALGCLFWTLANTFRDRAATGVLLGAFILSLGLEAVYSILNYYYLLPFLRNALVHSAELRMQYFGVNEFTPELARRFNINRAFGSMLFPNALAAYMILGIPGTAAVAYYMLQRYRQACDADLRGAILRGVAYYVLQRYRQACRHGVAEAPQWFRRQARRWALGIGLGVWLLCLLLLFLAQQFPIMYALDALPFYLRGITPFVTSLLLGAVPGFLVFKYAMKRGAFPALLLVGLCLVTGSLAAQCWTLLITYSRGGMLALVTAALLTALLFLIKHNKALQMTALRPTVSALLLLLPLLGVGAMLHQALHSGEAAAQAPPPTQSQSPARDAITQLDTRSVVTDRGIDIGMSDLADTDSMRLRFTYWQVGLRMFLDNPWTGVGLGNFGIAYPIYQQPTDGDVREAHNSYLQIFAEAGVAGGVFFAAFWTVVLYGMARRLWRETDRLHFVLLAGGFCGLLAFLGHALIDINFSHVGLSMLCMAWAGLWYAFARRHDEAPENAAKKKTTSANDDDAPEQRATALRPHQYIAIPILLAVALVFGLSLRPYLQELAIARMQFISVSGKADDVYNRRFRIVSHYTNEVANYAHTGEGQRPFIVVSDAMYLGIPLEDIVARDTVFQRMPETGGMRRLPEGAPVPSDGIVRIERLWPAFYDAVEAYDRYLIFLGRQYRRFPYNADLAYNIAQGYEHLLQHVDLPMRPELLEQYLERLEYWATEALRRSPRNKDMHLLYGKMLWHRGMLAEDGPNLDDLRASVAQHRIAASLAPASHPYVERYATVLRRMARQLNELGRVEEAARYAEEAQKMDARFERLTQIRIAAGLM